MDWKICDFMTHDRVLAARERFTQPIKNKKMGGKKERIESGEKKRIGKRKESTLDKQRGSVKARQPE